MTISMAQRYGPWALIAGGSEGIGLAFAQQLAKAGINLLLLARNAENLATASHQLRQDYDVQICTQALDLCADNVSDAIDDFTKNKDVGLLIYNAGAMHGADLFLDASFSNVQKLIALNCSGPALLAHKFGRHMRDRKRGGIILLSSMSGLAGGAYVTAYAASKAFDISLAEGLWAELKPFGVDVLGLIAGATATPAMARSGVTFTPEHPAMTAQQVATEGLENLGNGPLHVAGEHNRAFESMLRGDRAQAVEMMSLGAAGMYEKPYPPINPFKS